MNLTYNNQTGFLNKVLYDELGTCKGKTIYRIVGVLLFRCPDGSIIEIPDSFQTDLSSVPRFPIIYSMWGNRTHREPVLHDFVYRYDSNPILLRSEGDSLFKIAMISRNQPSYIYNPMYAGVRLGGWSSYHKLSVNHQFTLD